MATEDLYWASGQTFTLTNGTGAGTDIDDDPDSPDANQVDGSSNSLDLLVGFTTPTGPPAKGTNAQQFRVWLGKNGGGQSADWAIDVYENGTLRASAIATGNTATTSGELVTGNWTFTSGFTNSDGSGVEIKVRQTGGARDLFVGAIKWVADYVTQKSASDTLLPTIVDAKSYAIYLARSDAINPKIDESIAFALSQFTRSDTFPINFIDTLTFALSQFTRSDTFPLSILETAPSEVKALFGVQDTLLPKIDDVSFIPTDADSISSDPFDDQQTSIVITGSGFGVTQGTGKVEVGDNSVYASANLEEQTVTSWSPSSITFTGVVSTLGPSDSRWVFVTNDVGERSAGLLVGTHRAQAIALYASANVSPNPGDTTTAQLTPPSGKTTGDFGGGRLLDDVNPGGSIDIARNQYREDEWSLIALDAAILGQQYEFRVVITGQPANTPYDVLVLPVWTISVPSINKPVSDTLFVKVDELLDILARLSSSDTLTVSLVDFISIFSAFTRTDDLFVRIDSIVSIINSLSRTDDIRIKIDSLTSLLVTLNRFDALNPTLVDNLNTILSYLSRSDTLLPKIDDFLTILTSLFRSDTLAPKIDETISLVAFLLLSDTLLVSIDEVSALLVYLATMDDLLISATIDQINSILVYLTRTDDINPRIDSLITIVSYLSRSDTLLPKIDETLTLVAQLFRSDTLLPLISELTDIVALFSVMDDLKISQAIDQISTILVYLSRADAINPRIDELFTILVSMTRSDTLLPKIDETLTLLTKIATFDVFPITLDEFFSILSFVVGRFRWRNDDGTEATATWLQSENTNTSRSININTRLRIQVDTGGDTGSTQFALQWRKVGDPDWEWRDVQ